MRFKHKVTARLDDNEFNKVQELSKHFHKSSGVIVRACIDGADSMKKYQPVNLMKKNYQALGELNKIYAPLINDGNLLNQIAKAENTNGFADIPKRTFSKLRLVYVEIYKMLKKVVS